MSIFDFSFNIWAILSAVGVMVNLVLAVFILRQGSQNPANRWFSIVLFCLILWGVAEFLSRLSANAVAFQFWSKIGSPGWIFMSTAFFTFTLIFTKKEKIVNTFWFPLLVFFPAIIFLFLAWNTELIIINNPEDPSVVETYYGWDKATGKFFWIFIVWLEFYFWSSEVLLFRHFLRLESQTRRRQAFLIMAGCFIPLVLGTLTDAILPIFKIPFVETAVVFTTMLGIFICYGIIKYKLFIIVSPSVAFYNVLDTMTEGLFVLNQDFYIDVANKATLEMLGYREEELIGKHIEKVISDGKILEVFRARGLKPLKEGRTVRNLETKFLTKDAKVIPVNFSASSIKSKGEKQIGIVVVASDITQTKRLIHKLEKAIYDIKLSKYELEKKLGRIVEA